MTFSGALFEGQAADKGLYFPEYVPGLPADLMGSLDDRSDGEIAFEVIRPYVGREIPDQDLFEICLETVAFPFPLVEVSDGISSLELFHGPTLAFKDVGARFMSRCLRYFSREREVRTLVIVATSGDTGGAVASGFSGEADVDVVILYPKDKVSRIQELQLTTLGGNVTALEVRGNFDDCQALAKRALADVDLKTGAFITSANSINIARWLPQQFYFFFALKQWQGEPPVFSVPSGNFGNLAAGILAWRSGLPASFFIAACNANDVVPKFFESGDFRPQPSVPTLSNAMDVGNPSNLVRVLELFGGDLGLMRQHVSAVTVSDAETAETMKEVYTRSGYILDPHGAVGYRALADHLQQQPQRRGIFLGTAHPVKFDSVSDIVGTSGHIPASVEELMMRPKIAIEIDPDYGALKEVLKSNI